MREIKFRGKRIDNGGYMDLKNYKKIKFTEYVKHKGEPEWEIAWNKRQLELIDKDPTGGAREKRLSNIKHWEEMKKSAKRSN